MHSSAASPGRPHRRKRKAAVKLQNRTKGVAHRVDMHNKKKMSNDEWIQQDNDANAARKKMPHLCKIVAQVVRTTVKAE